jgi:mucin-19
LQLTKTTTSTFTVGQNATYTLTPNNLLGSAPTTGTITVTDTLPSGLTYVPTGSGGAGWTCNAAGQVVTCTSTAAIAVGGTGSPITINVSVGATAVPSVTNVASVAGGGEAPSNSANNSAVVTSPVGIAAVNTFLTDGAQTGLPGTSVTYPHTFNAGSSGTVSFATSDVPNPVIAGWTTEIFRDTNCDGVLSAAEAATPLTGSVAVTAGQQVCIITRSNIPAGAPFNARDVITTTSSFTPTAGGPVQTLTRQDITTVGAIGSGLTLSKSVRNVTQGTPAGTNNTALPGDVLEYTITYTNASNSPISMILVTDNTPAFTNFVSAQCTTPLPAGLTNCAVTATPVVGAAGTLQWTLTGSLNAMQTGSVTFRVTVQQ